jgi:hypothetical protein
MDPLNPNSMNNRWGYECFGPRGTVIQTDCQNEALFWHSLGYVVLHVSNWARNPV